MNEMVMFLPVIPTPQVSVSHWIMSQKMRFDRITYSIKPSFADSSFCHIEKDARAAVYSVFVKIGNAEQGFQISTENVLPILDAIERLSLPIPTDVRAFDGTVYSLKIGALNSVTYSWWEELPAEWSALEEIVKAIEAISGIKEPKRDSAVSN